MLNLCIKKVITVQHQDFDHLFYIRFKQDQDCPSSLTWLKHLVSMAESIIQLKFGPQALPRPFVSRKHAGTYFKAWVAKLEPALQQAIGFRTAYLEKGGWGMKLRLDLLDERAQEHVLTALDQLVGAGGYVTPMSKEDVVAEIARNELYKEKQQRKAGAVANFERISSVMENLQQYIGKAPKGRPTKRQKRTAAACSTLMDRAHKICSAGLKEGRSEDEDEGGEEDNDE